MAEVAGLVVGVVGLAGLIGAFKDTIDLFNDFADSRELGRDYEILDAKLEIERTILLQWVDRVNLLRPTYDRRLDDADTHKAVARSLACIRNLLSNEKELKHRFGVEEPEEQLDASSSINSASTISSRRLQKFVKEFEALNLRTQNHTKNPSLRNRVRWIIRDRQKFETLVEQLTYFVTKLQQIMPTPEISCMTNEDIGAIRNIEELKTLLAASLGHRHVVAQSTAKQIKRVEGECEDRILRKLWYRMMDDRYESITPAHTKTLQWALEPPLGHEVSWDDFSKWLLHESGVYWVSGKAGSGKSTLMKYLFHHQKTRRLLQEWADGRGLSMAKFCFFNLGTSLQKSQEGLSRALLYQILSKHRSLIAKALPNMWKQVRDTDVGVDLPSAAEIRHAFRVIAESTPEIGKLCFFIDGLDEFAGNYLDGIAFIKELVTSQDIKIVVSSRPESDCVESFSGFSMLELHHLTRMDIQSYVQDVIGTHAYMQRLSARHPQDAHDLMEDIVNKSSGVFLWVILACRSLISGFAAYDNTSELRKRVDELPPELEQMFQHMLSKVDRRNREQGARLLQICYTAYSQHCNMMSDVTTQGLALVDDASFDIDRILNLSRKQIRDLAEQMEGRLRSRCGGLLELAKGACLCGGSELKAVRHIPKIDTKVVFLHRTVFEFLNNDKVWELDCLQVPNGSDPYADLSLERFYSAVLLQKVDSAKADRFLHGGLKWGQLSDAKYPHGRRNIFWAMQSCLDILHHLVQDESPDSLLKRIFNRNCNHSTTGFPHAIRNLAVEAGAVNYVCRQLESRRDNLKAYQCGCHSILYQATALPLIRPKAFSIGADCVSDINPKMVGLILSSGADPNEKLRSHLNGEETTPWRSWRLAIKKECGEGWGGQRCNLDVVEIAKAFLRAGATISDDTQDWVVALLRRTENRKIERKLRAMLELISSSQSKRDGRKRPSDEDTSEPVKRARI